MKNEVVVLCGADEQRSTYFSDTGTPIYSGPMDWTHITLPPAAPPHTTLTKGNYLPLK